MEKLIRWGMIGTGDVTEKKSAPSFNKIAGSMLAAVGNRTPSKAEDYARRHGVSTWYRNPYDVIHDPGVDIIYVATPPGSHLEYAMETLKAGKPVYIEKPMARSWDECDAMNREAQKKGLPLFVAYYRRSLEYFLKVRELISRGSLGKIHRIDMRQHFAAREEDFRKAHLPWRVIPEISGGGYFHDMGCHALDILFFIFGDPLEVHGTATNKGGLYEAPDTLTARMILPGEVVVDGTWSFTAGEDEVEDRVVVKGANGTLAFSVFSFDPIKLLTGEYTPSFHTTQPEHIQMPFIQSIVQQLLGKGTCPSTGESAAVTSRVMDQITGAL